MGVIVVCDTDVLVRDTHLLRKNGGPDLVRQLRAAPRVALCVITGN
jgi:hypothetical protein